MPDELAANVYDTSESFAEIYKIWEAIQNHVLGPALEWAAKYSDELAAKNSALEFKLHRLAFMQVSKIKKAMQTKYLHYFNCL